MSKLRWNLSHERQCPAQGKTCRKCGKFNHFAKVCRGGAKLSHRTRDNKRPQQTKTKSKERKSIHPVSKVSESESSDEEYLYTVKSNQTPKINVKVYQHSVWFQDRFPLQSLCPRGRSGL